MQVLRSVSQLISQLTSSLIPANDNLELIIKILITILVIAQIILVVNAIVYVDTKPSNDYDANLQRKQKCFQYFASNNYMSIDRFILMYDNPFVWLFIAFPIIYFIVLYIFNQDIRRTLSKYKFLIFIIVWFIIFAIAFVSIYSETIKDIAAFEKDIIPLNIDNIKKNDGNKLIDNTEKQLILNKIRDNIILQIDSGSFITNKITDAITTEKTTGDSSIARKSVTDEIQSATKILTIIFNIGKDYKDKKNTNPDKNNIKIYNLYIDSIYKYFNLKDIKDVKSFYNILGLADNTLVSKDFEDFKDLKVFKKLLNTLQIKFEVYYITLIAMYFIFYMIMIMVFFYNNEINYPYLKKKIYLNLTKYYGLLNTQFIVSAIIIIALILVIMVLKRSN